MGCDVACNWVFDESRPATAEAIDKARTFLEGRVSLGWTDLEKTFAAALAKCGPQTQVLYFGDGVNSAGQADSADVARRLRYLYDQAKTPATFHAVALGSSYESTVLKAIASLGGGSMRTSKRRAGRPRHRARIARRTHPPRAARLQSSVHRACGPPASIPRRFPTCPTARSRSSWAVTCPRVQIRPARSS